MSKSLKITVFTVSILVIAFALLGTVSKASTSTADGAYRQFGVFSEVLSRIRSEYVEEPNIPRVTDGALHGLLEALDSNSSYLNPDEYKEFKQAKESKGNIGATLSKRFGYVAIVSVLPNSPAEKAALHDGDIIESVEGKGTRELGLAEVKRMIAGEPGSRLNVTVVRARRVEPEKITLIREVVQYPAIAEKTLEQGIGYIQVGALPKGRAQEIGSKIKDLQKNGARKLILDLREVSEGEISEGVALANLFLDHGLITTLQGQKFAKQTFNADPAKAITKLPVVVLVNRGTAGAAEITAAAILDNARGDVVGDRTFGIGSVQKTIDLPDGGAIILSVAKYYTPSGKLIQDTAIIPNVLVADTNDDFVPDTEDEEAAPPDQTEQPKEDLQLKRAIEVLKAKDQKAALAQPAIAAK